MQRNQGFTSVPVKEEEESTSPKTLEEIDAFLEQEDNKLEEDDKLEARGIVASSSSGNHRRVIASQSEGVFANMAAKPEVVGKTYEEMEPPAYEDVEQEEPPNYLETTFFTTGITSDGEVLVEGFPVGDYVTFLVNMFVSTTFDFLGFLLTSILATSHAARYGSQAGLGLTLMRVGALVRSRNEINSDDQFGPNSDSTETQQRRDWTGFLLLTIGLFIVLRANAEYFRLHRLEAVIQSTPSII